MWDEVRELVATNPGLEAKTLMEALQRKYPGQFGDGQVRTLTTAAEAVARDSCYAISNLNAPLYPPCERLKRSGYP